MKLNFIVNNKEEEINIDNIYLSPNNPRYTSLEKIDMNLFDLIISESDLSQEKVMLELLQYEGDFKDFLELIESIRNIGFQNKNDKIILLKNNNGEYVCAEGNRRILALKFICGSSIFPTNFLDSNDLIIDNIENPYFDNDSERNVRFLRSKNIELIKKIIVDINKKNNNMDVNIKFLKREEEEDLWDIIYDKHLTGEKPGAKKWSRGKYYADLMCLLHEGVGESSSLKIKKFLQIKLKRTMVMAIQDFKNAQFVYKIFQFGLGTNEKKIILDSMKKKQVSALEPIFSINKIKKIAKTSIYIGNKDIDSYFDYTYDKKNNLIEIKKDNIIDEKDIFKFIYDNSIVKKIITTRDIQKKYIEKFRLDVFELYSLDMSVDVIDKNNINLLQIKNNDLNAMILEFDNEFLKKNDPKWERKSDSLRKIIEFRNNVLSLTNRLKKDDEEIDNWMIFSILFKQIIHNQNDDFYHAICSTIRTFYDLLFCYSFIYLHDYNDDFILKFKKDIGRFMKKKFKIEKEKKLIYDFDEIKLEGFLKDTTGSYKILNFIKSNWNTDYKKTFCGIIHAPYKILEKDFFQKDLERLNMWIENTNDIIGLLDWAKMKKVSDAINQK